MNATVPLKTLKYTVNKPLNMAIKSHKYKNNELYNFVF